jgi:hypothetical protein
MNAIAPNADQMLNDRKSWGHAPAGWYPLSLVQRGIWRSNQLKPESRGFNNLAFCATVFGQIDSRRLAKALDTLAARHQYCVRASRSIMANPGSS